MFTKEEIYNQLKAMNAPKNSVVTVHTSLKAVGETEGRGEGLLEVLIKYFTEDGGLLCIPTHTWDNAKSKVTKEELTEHPTLDMNSSYTCIGTLPSLAAAHPDAHRSEHPTHSMAVFGDAQRAEEFIKDDAFAKSSADPKGCYGKIYGMGGYILLLGVGHNKNTFIHCVEDLIGVKNRLSKEPLDNSVKRKSGEVVFRKVRITDAEGIGDVSQYYGKFEPAFRYHGAIKDGVIGNAKVQLCSAQKIKDVVELVYKRANGAEIMDSHTPLDEKLYK